MIIAMVIIMVNIPIIMTDNNDYYNNDDNVI